MREYLNIDRAASKLRLLRDTFKGSVLIVEGSSDKKFYANFIDDQQCHIEVAPDRPDAKANALALLSKLEKAGFLGILAIVDADFSFLESKTPGSPNLFLTDYHDLELLLIISPALKKVLTEFGSEAKVNTFIINRKKEIVNALLESGSQIGRLRWLNYLEDLSLTFDESTITSYLNKDTLEVDVTKMVTVIKNKSQKHHLNEQELLAKMQTIQFETDYFSQVCCGHDVTNILSIGLRKVLGSNNASEVDADRIESSLRLAYEASFFALTVLYKSIKQWENRNTSYIVLAV